ncbi:condensation domain-containing protein [Saccharothrix yanglingensis]|uniref:condensation domain-containing protein n=1 Tax=Saccharothrix yanglingensis TaxID=659496 RepID=UPI0027D22F33|nr:condensation domain-containing protein [Saccharothrix yanglingensis]
MSRSPRHIVALALRIKGELRVDALRGALDEVVERQEALRTRVHYDEADGTRGFLEVLPAMPVPLAVHDIPETPGRSRDDIALDLLDALNQESMSYLDAPSLRATLHRFDDHDAVLTLLSHHLFNDGWSVGVLRREIAACYRARVTGVPHALPTPRPYQEFASWEEEFLRSERAESARRYWKDKLAGAEMCTLPTDRPYDPATHGPSSAVRNFTIDPGTLAKITESAARHRCSVWHVFLAAYMVLVEKISGQSDITLLTVNSGRPSRDFYNTIGFFSNLVPVRLEFDDCTTFLDLMLRARKASTDAQQNQLPLESILEMYPHLLNGSGDPMALPSGFNYIGSPAEHEDTGFTTSVEPVTAPEEQPASFRRGVFIWTFLAVAGGDFRCVVEYEPEAVDAATVDRWGAEFLDLVLAMTDRPDQVWNRR